MWVCRPEVKPGWRLGQWPEGKLIPRTVGCSRGRQTLERRVVDMCIDEQDWAGSPQKARFRKLRMIAEHLNAFAGARAAKIP